MCVSAGEWSVRHEGQAPILADVSATTLATINDAWEAVTFVYLHVATGADAVRFRITELPSKGELLDYRDGGWCRVPSGYVTETTQTRRHALRYVSYRNRVGTDTFKFQAINIASGGASSDATATITIERGGLKWQIVTNASTAFSTAAANDTHSGVIGDSAPEALFRLDWQWTAPRKNARITGDGIWGNRAPDSRHQRRRSAHWTLVAG